MNRPTGMADRRTAQEARRVAALRAALAARRAEQAAAARRRLVLTLALVAVAAVSWAAVALADFSILLAAFPTAVLVAVVVLGVRAARAERSEWAEVPASLKEPRAARSAGPTYSPSQLRSHLTPAGASGATVVRNEAVVEDAAEEAATAGSLRWTTEHAILTVDEPVVAEQEAPAAETAEAAPGSWTPVPVPVPTYTLKPVAPRRETAPYAAEDEQQAEVLDTAADAGEQGIDLRAVLARRRAVGA